MPEQQVIEQLQRAIQTQEALDILCGKFYLVAYCHLRRANRTFRLDRLRILSAAQD